MAVKAANEKKGKKVAAAYGSEVYQENGKNLIAMSNITILLLILISKIL